MSWQKVMPKSQSRSCIKREPPSSFSDGTRSQDFYSVENFNDVEDVEDDSVDVEAVTEHCCRSEDFNEDRLARRDQLPLRHKVEPYQKSRYVRRKAAAFSERETAKLIGLYLENRSRFHAKFTSGSKSGKSEKEYLLEEWAAVLSNLGIAIRTKEQVEEKLRNEIKRVQRYLKAEKTKLTGTGGGTGPYVRPLPLYLEPLVDVLAESHCISGVPGLGDEITSYSAEEAHGKVDLVRDVKGEAHHCDIPTIKPVQQVQKPIPVTKKSLISASRERLLDITDSRTRLYEEEIELVKLKKKQVELATEKERVLLEKAKVELEKERALLEQVKANAEREVYEVAQYYE